MSNAELTSIAKTRPDAITKTYATELGRSIPVLNAEPTSVAKIKLDAITKTYATELGRSIPVLNGLSADFDDGEFVSIIGPSGCGKTTLLYLIAGLTPPTTGSILLDGKQISGPARERGMIFQQDVILLWRTVQKNAEYGLELAGMPRKERAEIANRYLEMVGLNDFAGFYPKELSGGMKKRTQIAAVFANNPNVLLMDEPFGALDYLTKMELQMQLLKIWDAEKKLVLFVTHDLEEALFLSTRIIAMDGGKIAESYKVPFDFPRSDDLRVTPEFQQAKAELWQIFKH